MGTVNTSGKRRGKKSGSKGKKKDGGKKKAGGTSGGVPPHTPSKEGGPRVSMDMSVTIQGVTADMLELTLAEILNRFGPGILRGPGSGGEDSLTKGGGRPGGSDGPPATRSGGPGSGGDDSLTKGGGRGPGGGGGDSLTKGG